MKCLDIGQHFLENQQSEFITFREKKLTFEMSDEIQAFKQKLEFWKTFIHHCDLNNI
jgi:hypothetical protein